MRNYAKQKGFTIVELLIVVVVIAILASIAIVSYGGIQARARDARRLSDVQAIVSALQMYVAVNGDFPDDSANPGVYGVEASTDAQGTFIDQLKTAGFLNDVPVDPINTVDYYYGYYRYEPGWTNGMGETNGCDDARGNYFIVYVNKFETVSGTHPASPRFSCPNRDWSPTQWVAGGYVN